MGCTSLFPSFAFRDLFLLIVSFIHPSLWGLWDTWDTELIGNKASWTFIYTQYLGDDHYHVNLRLMLHSLKASFPQFNVKWQCHYFWNSTVSCRVQDYNVFSRMISLAVNIYSSYLHRTSEQCVPCLVLVLLVMVCIEIPRVFPMMSFTHVGVMKRSSINFSSSMKNFSSLTPSHHFWAACLLVYGYV